MLKFSMSLTHHMIASYSNLTSTPCDWCIANSMRLNTAKTRVVSYTRETNFLCYNH
jgi:hypothetical protein